MFSIAGCCINVLNFSLITCRENILDTKTLGSRSHSKSARSF